MRATVAHIEARRLGDDGPFRTAQSPGCGYLLAQAHDCPVRPGQLESLWL